jgi:hypothetical protein
VPETEHPVDVSEHVVLNVAHDKSLVPRQETKQFEAVRVDVQPVVDSVAVCVGWVEMELSPGVLSRGGPSVTGGDGQLPIEMPKIRIQGKWNLGKPKNQKSMLGMSGRFQKMIPWPPSTTMIGTNVVCEFESVVVIHSLLVYVVPVRVDTENPGG